MKREPFATTLARREAPTASRALAIAAHPDDIESWCAGTLALLSDRGAQVGLVLVTAGECGSGDPLATRATVAARREAEARAAAQFLRLAEVVVLGYPDGGVEDTAALRADLVAAIRRWRPDVVFTHDPEHPYPPYLSHRDHRVVGRAALDAVYPLARDRLSFPEHEAAVEISASFERKLAARLAYHSQTPDPAVLAEAFTVLELE